MPQPEVQILVCVNERPPTARKPSCGCLEEGPRSALEIYRRFKDCVRERGVRDRVMVTRTGCLKHCSHGVVVALWPMRFWYREVTLDDVEEIVDQSALGGREIERLRMPDVPWE